MEFRWIDWNRDHIAKHGVDWEDAERVVRQKAKMRRKKRDTPYWEMTVEQLGEATKEFDQEFVADKAQPLTPEMRRRWERAKAKLPRLENGVGQKTIVVRLEKALLDRCSALAKKKRISRDA